MSKSIRLHPERGINARLTYCFRCGGDGQELMLIGINEGKYQCAACQTIHYGYPKGNVCQSCGTHDVPKIGTLDEFEKLPTGAIGLYTYYERLAQGLRQLMCGARKFDLSFITRDDIASLTRDAAEISGINYIQDVDEAEVQEILGA